MEGGASPDSLVVKVAFDRQERHGAVAAANRYGPLWRRPVVMLPVMVVGAALIAAGQQVLQRVLHLGDPSVVATVLIGLLAAGGAIYAFKLNRRRIEEAERHEQNPDVYTLNDAGLEINGADDLTLLPWSDITRVHETDRLFVFVAGSEVQYLPKRALDQERVDLVRGLIARHGPGKRIPAAT